MDRPQSAHLPFLCFLDISATFQQAGRITFGRPFRWLWLPAFLLTLALDLPGLLLRPFLPDLADLNNPERFENLALFAGDLTQNISGLVIFGLLFSIGLGGLWAIATIGQGVLIDGVGAIHKGESKATIEHWRTGRKLLWPFIAIDTIIFFPLFILLLLILLILIAVLTSVLIDLAQTRTLAPSPLMGIGVALIIPLTCLILPASLLTVLYRFIAFRLAALDKLGIRESIRQVRPFLRQNIGPLLILAGLTGAIYYLTNGLFFAIGGGMRYLGKLLEVGPIEIGMEGVIALLTIIAATLRNLFISACWTIGVVDIAARK